MGIRQVRTQRDGATGRAARLPPSGPVRWGPRGRSRPACRGRCCRWDRLPPPIARASPTASRRAIREAPRDHPGAGDDDDGGERRHPARRPTQPAAAAGRITASAPPPARAARLSPEEVAVTVGGQVGAQSDGRAGGRQQQGRECPRREAGRPASPQSHEQRRHDDAGQEAENRALPSRRTELTRAGIS